MGLPRIYSIQAKLTMVFLFIVVIITGSGMLSVYFSKRHLASARFFTDTIIPGIQAINDLQQAASLVEGHSRALARAPSPDALALGHGDLQDALARMEKLTAAITHQDNGIDIVSLNFLSQAIRSQAQLVFQLKAHLLEMISRRKRTTQGIRRDLMALIALTSARESSCSGPDHKFFHDLLERSVSIMEELNTPSALPLNIRQLEQEFKTFQKENGYQVGKPARPAMPASAQTLVNRIIEETDQLLAMNRDALEINQRIDAFITALDELTARLILMTGRYIQTGRDRFRKNAEQILKKEKKNINLTTGGLLLSIAILYLLHWQIIVRGFGNRLSMISQAMGQEDPAKGQDIPLPLKGRDEIADMARAAGELLKKAEKLNTLATIDELTQVHNRRYFFQLAETEVKRAARKKDPAIVLMLDIDHFKRINDTWGHDFGDRVLREFARACSRETRAVDLFARYGGEEFVILMPETSLDQGMNAAKRLRDTVASLELATDSGQTVGLTVSIGMTEAELASEGIDASIKKADTALYAAKNLGRNRIEVYKQTRRSDRVDT